MEKLLSDYGEYFYTAYYGKNDVIFSIIGTKAAVNAKNCLSCVDTFKSDKKGTIVEIKREEILAQVKLGKMKPVLDSLISSSAKKVELIKTTKKKK